MPPPQSPPNPFARPSPWGNLPPTRIRVEGRAAPPAGTQPLRSRPDSRAVMLSGFSVPPPRPRPAAAPPPEPRVEAPVPQVADIAVEETAFTTPLATPARPPKARRGVPATAIVAGGFVLSVVAGLAVGAISLTGRPPAPPAAVAPPASPIAAPRVEAPAPVAEAGVLPELVADPAIQVKRAAARAVMARKPATSKSVAREPTAPEAAPLLAVPPAAPAVVPTPLFGPVPLVRAPVDPEAPIPTRTRAPD